MKPSNSMSQTIELLAKEIVKSKHLIAFTGAGISTESGIPDYRSKGGKIFPGGVVLYNYQYGYSLIVKVKEVHI